MNMLDSDIGPEPVTVSVARKIKPEREADYEAWIKGVTAAAATYRGHQGVSVVRPSPATNGEYVLIYRFDSYENGRAWEESDMRKTWVEKLDGIAAGEATYKKVTGLEFWFDLPNVPVHVKPSPHKMALTMTIVVFMLVYALQATIGVVLNAYPLWFKVLVIVTLQVVLLTYIVMPRVTQLLKPWLFKTK